MRLVVGFAAIAAVMVLVLRGMGRLWWCACGSAAPWTSDIHSSHNSQHLADPYVFTHMLHGVLLYGFLWLTVRRWTSVRTRGLLAVGLEAVWEIVENTDLVIERYRRTAVSLHYFGDSIANSLGDLLACAGGFTLAAILPFWGSVALLVATELTLYLWVRDNLFLAVWTLFFPER